MTTSQSRVILEMRDISFRYPNGGRGLEQCSISFERGMRTALLGLNGAGKTTLFLQCNGVLRPQSGEVLLDGVPLNYSRLGLRTLRSRIGLVFQNPDSQLFSASVREDVSFGPLNLGLPITVVRDRVEQSLAAVGMSDFADRPVHALSYGQKKRVCIAGVLAMAPEVLILDEPMAGLDAAMQTELAAVLDELHDKGMTIIIATHDIDFAYQWADRINVLEAGRCAATWDAIELPQVIDNLKRFGIGVPKVAELHRHLLDAGLVTAGSPIPRSHHQLLQQVSLLSGFRF
ncbi:MAG: ABC transporter ATP-binding protein [Desulfuromonadales bacterium]|nr:ABC transporter ATP-binding protein [Desulfuromonadales bacterium]